MTTSQHDLPRPASAALRGAGRPVRAGVAAAGAPHAAFAQGRLDAQYEATLAGIPVGKGAWTIDISDDQFSASASGGTSGLLKAFAGGSGTGAAQGRVVGGALVATNYSATTTTSKKSEAIHIVLANGNVKEFGIEPEPPVDADRIPVTDAQRRGVYDPMTGSMLRVPGTCRSAQPRGLPHRRRRSSTAACATISSSTSSAWKPCKAEKGYHGPAVVCAIYFTPVAGYIPDRPVIKYLAAQRNIEIAFVPIAGTRILVPFRMMIPTPLGLAMLEATQFITTATPPRVAKTQ